MRAGRIGKQYRVAREAVDALTGRSPAVTSAAPAGERHVEVSSIVHVDAIDLDTANRIATALLAAAKGRPDTPDPLRIDTVYDPARARLKVFLSGSVAWRTTLAETGGDLDAAMERLRDVQTTMAAKKAGRETTEGLVAMIVDGRRGAVVEVNCETDSAEALTAASAAAGAPIHVRAFVRYRAGGAIEP